MATATKTITVGSTTFVVTLEDTTTEIKIDVEAQEASGAKIMGIGGGRPKCP